MSLKMPEYTLSKALDSLALFPRVARKSLGYDHSEE